MKSKKVFESLAEALLKFLKGLYLLGILADDTAMVIGDEDKTFVIETMDDDEDDGPVS